MNIIIKLQTGSMNKKLHLAFVWHMHQPYYRDDIDQKTQMPWVFLHAIKDYYDLPWYMSKFQKEKATFNLVPSLLFQIESYINGNANDRLLLALQKDIHNLSKDEKDYLESYLFLSNEKNMVKPLKRYYNLYIKYKNDNTIDHFSYNELLDTQVLFLLSWCGVYLRENAHVIKSLLQKGENFTQQDKEELLHTLIKFLGEIVPFYKSLSDKGQISLITTPYYHPITPLLLDINSATEARYNVTLPAINADFREFAKKNTEYAIEYFEELFGKKPTGFWPAEGSVSNKTASLFAQNGIKWFCSDEEVLYKSIHNYDKKNIYKNYSIQIEDKTIEVRFRDKYLSDLIGFEYSNKNALESALDFIAHLRNIYDSCDFSPLVNVILDGENAWEFFPNNALEFFETLYSLLEKEDWIESIHMDEISQKEDIQTEIIHSLASGSWINGNFDIWIGSEQKNRAWELLDITKKDYDKEINSINSYTKQLIEKEFMIALGSDWFWWYGDDHFTVQKAEFDALFRKHLINIYNLLNLSIPIEILTPIVKKDNTNTFHRKPLDCISPQINDKKTSYYEWLNSGFVDLKQAFSVMDSSSIIKSVRYGYDLENLYFAFNGDLSDLKKESYLIITLNDKIFKLKIKDGLQELEMENTSLTIFHQKRIEVAIKRSIFKDSQINFKFQIILDGKVKQSFPIQDDFIISIENLKLKNWFV